MDTVPVNQNKKESHAHTLKAQLEFIQEGCHTGLD